MIKKAIVIFQARGMSGLLRAIRFRARSLLAGQAKSFLTYKDLFVGKSGIEIGGPSQTFSRKGIFPVYPLVENLDNCNFSGTTVWGDSADQGRTYQFDLTKPCGQQHIAEATAMEGVLSNVYDFVLSSHMLEHTANPILALSEWKRVLKNDGILVLLLPDRKRTFDHRRPVSTLKHLIADFNVGMAEDDLTHLSEILALHDLKRDPEAGDIEDFKERSMRNLENRCLHHHVFDAQLAVDLVKHVGMKIHSVEEFSPHHILLLARKVKADDF